MKTIIIDDELQSLNSLHKKLKDHCTEVEVIGMYHSAMDGLDAIEKSKPELVFLDIEMPVMNGFTLIQRLNYRYFELIFVTAYNQYPIQAIRCGALDYLVKPVETESLQAAVKRALEKSKNDIRKGFETFYENILESQDLYRKIGIPTAEGMIFVRLDQIVYLRSDGNYTYIFLSDQRKCLVSKTMKKYEEILPCDTFIRIHHSLIINKNFVEKYIRGNGGQVVLAGNITLNISKRKRAAFLKAIGS